MVQQGSAWSGQQQQSRGQRISSPAHVSARMLRARPLSLLADTCMPHACNRRKLFCRVPCECRRAAAASVSQHRAWNATETVYLNYFDLSTMASFLFTGKHLSKAGGHESFRSGACLVDGNPVQALRQQVCLVRLLQVRRVPDHLVADRQANQALLLRGKGIEQGTVIELN